MDVSLRSDREAHHSPRVLNMSCAYTGNIYRAQLEIRSGFYLALGEHVSNGRILECHTVVAKAYIFLRPSMHCLHQGTDMITKLGVCKNLALDSKLSWEQATCELPRLHSEGWTY